MADEQGTIAHIIDCGSVVQVFIETEDGTRVLCADGNMWRKFQQAVGRTSLTGDVFFDWADCERPSKVLCRVDRITMYSPVSAQLDKFLLLDESP